MKVRRSPTIAFPPAPPERIPTTVCLRQAGAAILHGARDVSWLLLELLELLELSALTR